MVKLFIYLPGIQHTRLGLYPSTVTTFLIVEGGYGIGHLPQSRHRVYP